jgi:hypothetical protein
MRITQSVILTTALAITFSSARAAIIFSDDFNGDASDLDGASPDVGTGNWVASNVFNRDGSIDPNPGSATLAFTPSNGNIYSLDASLSGVSGNGNWFALGFGRGQSIISSAGNRFINNLLIGKSWMLFRGNDDGHQAFRGSATSGTFDGSPWTALGTVTGAIDLRIQLDTTGGTGAWATTWFAKLPTDGAYTEVRPTEVLADESINSVGLALANTGIDGNVDSFSLTSIPEPSSIAMLGLGALALAGRRRKS